MKKLSLTNFILGGGIRMKLIFLHGLGQTPNAWQDIMEELPISNTMTVPLFSDVTPTDTVDLTILNKKLSAVLDNLSDPYILCGLSLGGVLALKQTIRKQPLLKGIIVSGAQFESPNRWLLTIQSLYFHLLPKKAFSNLGVTKKQMIEIANSTKQLQLRKELSKVSIPTLVICGSKDSINLSAAKELAMILPNSTLQIISGGGHELNREKPQEFAKVSTDFLNQHILL